MGGPKGDWGGQPFDKMSVSRQQHFWGSGRAGETKKKIEREVNILSFKICTSNIYWGLGGRAV